MKAIFLELLFQFSSSLCLILASSVAKCHAYLFSFENSIQFQIKKKNEGISNPFPCAGHSKNKSKPAPIKKVFKKLQGAC